MLSENPIEITVHQDEKEPCHFSIPDPEMIWVYIEHHCPESEPENVEVDFESLREWILGKATKEHQEFILDLTKNATPEERDTWKPKEEAAIAYMEGTAKNHQTDMLTSEAVGRGIEIAALCEMIIKKAELYQRLIGIVSGFKSKIVTESEKMIAAGFTTEQFSFKFLEIFDNVRAETNQLIAECILDSK